MTTHSLLLLPGDGIGPEVMAEVERVVAFFNKKGKVAFKTDTALCGGCSIDKHGTPLTDEALAKAQAADAIVFGAVGGPKWDKVAYALRPEAGLLGCARSSTCSPTCAPPSAMRHSPRPPRSGASTSRASTSLILRELTGGTYFGEPKEIVTLENGEKRAVDTTVYTTHEIERIARVAFDLARKRKNKVHSADKRNVMKTGVLWHEVVTATHAREAKDVELQHILADACAMQLVRNPKQFDVIVTDNLFGDMLSDEAAMLTGSHRHAAFGLARRAGCQDRRAQGAVRAGARLRARHRRQGPRQPDRGDCQLRHGAALLLRADERGRPDRQGHRRRARRGASAPATSCSPTCARSAPPRWARPSSRKSRSSRREFGSTLLTANVIPAQELVKETWFNDNRRASEKEAAGFSPMRHPPPLHRPAA